MKQNLKLDEYQQNVQKLSGMVARMGSSDSPCGPPKVFKAEGGEARVWKLYEDDDVSIVKSSITPNTFFPIHKHDTVEHIVLFRGSAYMIQGELEIPFRVGEVITVCPETPHGVKSGADGAWFSVTTVPREEGLVDGEW